MIGVYKITSPTGKVYIGQSWNVPDRFRRYKRKQCKKQRKLYASICKHGYESHLFEVIHECEPGTTQAELNALEIKYIEHYQSLGCGMMNIKEGGSNGKHSQETLDRMKAPRSEQWALNISRANKGKPSRNKGVPQSPELIRKRIDSKIKNGNTGKGKSLSEEVRIKISEKLKGRPNPNKGYKWSAESIAQRTATRKIKGLKKYKTKSDVS